MSLDNRVQSSVVENLRRRPRPVEVGPFVIGCDPTTDNPFINYATPVPGVPVTPADVADLVEAFERLERKPRLEYVTTIAPELEGHLLAAGFTVEERHEYLVCAPETLAVPPAPEGFSVTEPADDDEVRAMLAAQSEAFGGEPTATDTDVQRARRNQSQGGIAIVAREPSGMVVGGGQSSPPNLGLTEVAGIAVAKDFRRRGLAGAITAVLAERAFAAGVELAWLEASGDTSWRVYERVGFRPQGKRLYIAYEGSKSTASATT
ncbi:MAG TPA: GNAT family N-acetyltransferase [Candidatus Limnocylindrales bacterium]